MTGTLIRADGTALSYDRFAPDSGTSGCGVVFLHGYRSDKGATKAAHLGRFCRAAGIPYVAFDFFAHGASGGEWAGFTISRAIDDAVTVLDTLTLGPQIVVGSSMGGWVGLHTLALRPGRVAGFVGVAAAPDFTLWVERDSTPEERLAQGFTDALLADGRKQTVMDKPITFSGPVHLLQGQRDDDVPWQTALTLRDKFPNPAAVALTLVPDGDHRLNRSEHLEQLEAAILDVKSRL